MAQPDDTKVKLTWDHAAGKSFFVYYGTAQDILKATKFVDATGMDVTVTGLINGTKYYFWLVAGKFPNVVSNMASATPLTVPEAPTGLTATPGNSQLTLSWAAPASDGGSPVSRYNVFEGTAADLSRSAPVTNVTGTAVTLPGLINGTTYYFRVTAVNRAGEGQPSNEVQAVPVTEPGAPTGLTATAGNAQATLSWTAPASDGGSKISGYVIYKGTSSNGETRTPVNGSLVTATSYTVTGLANGTTYYFTVTAVNRIGDSPASNEVSAAPVTVPGAPTGLTATRGNAQATLSWTASASDGGSQVTGYDLYVGTTADLSANAPVARVTGTVVTVTGLVNGTTYYFTVTAVNRIGDSPASNEVRAAPETVPGAPTGLTATPGNARATLSWAAPPTGGAPISGYLIYQGTSPNGETRTPVNGSLVNATSYTVTGLTNGTTYYFRVVAVNAAGQGLSSAEALATLRPIVPTSPPPTTSSTTPRTPSGTKPSGFAAPTGLTATPGDTRVHLSWAAPASDGGSVISYKVYFASHPGVQESAAIGTAKSTDAIVAGLADGITYYFMVAAVDASGNESPLSAQVAAEPITGPTVAVTSPGPPKRLIALLAAVAAMAVAGALTLITRHKRPFGSRKPAHSARSGEQAGAAADVRAVPGTARPHVVNVRDTGREPTHTVRLEPHPGITTTTLKEGRP